VPYKDKAAQVAYQNNWLKARRREWLTANGPCRCGSWDRLEVDHRNREHKVSHRIWSWAKARRDEELKKCQPLCFKCHKKKTAKEQFVHGVSGYKRGCRCMICRPAKLAEMREYNRRRRAIPTQSPTEEIHV
jgi:hypothetical protein